MALVLADRVRETTLTTGTGAVTLSGAFTGYITFLAGVGNANTTYYTIYDSEAGAWEVGIGTYTSAGNTLSRTTILASSNAGAVVNLAAGTKEVFVTQPAERAIYVDSTSLKTGNAIFTANGILYANSTSTAVAGASFTFNGTTVSTTGSYDMATATSTAFGTPTNLTIGAAATTLAMAGTGTGARTVTIAGAATSASTFTFGGAATSATHIIKMGTGSGGTATFDAGNAGSIGRLFPTITTGAINIAAGQTTGSLAVMGAQTSGNLSFGATAATGTINVNTPTVTFGATSPALLAGSNGLVIRPTTASQAVVYPLTITNSPTGAWTASAGVGINFYTSYNNAAVSTAFKAGELSFSYNNTGTSTSFDLNRYGTTGTVSSLFSYDATSSSLFVGTNFDRSTSYPIYGPSYSNDTAVGNSANVYYATGGYSLPSVTSGPWNVALGIYARSVLNSAAASATVVLGASTVNIGDRAGSATFSGAGSFSYTQYDSDIAIGALAGAVNFSTASSYTRGYSNISIGATAGYQQNSSYGSYNVYLGQSAGQAPGYGDQNICIGYNAGNASSSVGSDNIFIGHNSGNSASSGVTGAVIIGQFATVASNDVVIGSGNGSALFYGTYGSTSYNSLTLNNNNALTIGSTGGITFTDNEFTLQDNVDNTKKAQFQLSGLTTATTFTYTLPALTGTLATTGTLTQTFTGATTFSGTFTASSTFTLNQTSQTISLGTSQTTGTWTAGGTAQTGAMILGRSTGAQTVSIANGATVAASTKTVDIGTAGASFSTTNITYGSSVVNATSNHTFYGNIGVTSAPVAGYRLLLSGVSTPAPAGNAYGVANSVSVQSDVTSTYRSLHSTLSTQAAAFTVSNLFHFNSNQGTIGSGSVAATQAGFITNSSLTDATNNYGFLSQIAAPTSGISTTGTITTISSSTTTVTVNHNAITYTAGQTVTIAATANITAITSGAPCTLLTLGTTTSLPGAASAAVTFTDTGDFVTYTAHGMPNFTPIFFSAITTTTGITTNTLYYVINATTNTFQVASTVNGSALALTTNGTGTCVQGVFTANAAGAGTATVTLNIQGSGKTVASPASGSFNYTTTTSQTFAAITVLTGSVTVSTRYNFYASGTAPNYFGGNTIVETTDNTNAALRITQLGTGNALLVEDSTNPDASPFVIDASGNVVVGYTARVTNTSLIEAHSSAAVSGAPAISAYSWQASTTGSAAFNLYKSQSGTVGTFGASASGASSAVNFWFDDGSAFIRGAAIQGVVDGTPGTNDMPGRLVFSTTADGGTVPTERMRIDSAGRVNIGGTSTASYLSLSGTIPASAADTVGINLLYTIPSTATTSSRGFYTQTVSTQATAFTLPTFRHFEAGNVTVGAGSTLTEQIGFRVGAISSATNNYGFVGAVASATGSYNLYMSGTADNYFAGNVGIGVTSPTAVLNLKAGTATASTSPLKFTSGTNLTSVEAGSVEYDGNVFYGTADVTSGRGLWPTIQYFRLTADGSAITTIANFFGGTSGITLDTSAFYEVEYNLFFTKTTAGTATFTMTFANAPINNDAWYVGTPVGGVGTAGTAQTAAIVKSTATAGALPATGSLTTAVNHQYTVKAMFQANATTGGTLNLQATSSAGSITPLIGSYYKITRLPAANTGAFV